MWNGYLELRPSSINASTRSRGEKITSDTLDHGRVTMFSGGRAGRNQVTRHCLPACAPRGVAIGAAVCLASFMAGGLLSSSLSLLVANRGFFMRSFFGGESERFGLMIFWVCCFCFS